MYNPLGAELTVKEKIANAIDKASINHSASRFAPPEQPVSVPQSPLLQNKRIFLSFSFHFFFFFFFFIFFFSFFFFFFF